ncbi:response regulator [Paenibacillus sp. GCM10027628]|uniref:response regulator n=1 Tax=Paenibacillus sp. GCM10027628 TaxID=3273413 RepID=UPI0036340454
MKLLFAEDEKFTREGIRKSIHWEDLGITEIAEAVDGLEAVALCEQFQPDIVLSDIRMPRMDGIELAFHLRRKYPQCKIVFMSGYADKEYLKAAISLKAVSYVEKPIDIEELEEAIRGAVAICRDEQRHQANDAVARENKDYIKQEAALQLIRGAFDEDQLQHRLLAAGFEGQLNGPATTVLVKLVTPPITKEDIAKLLGEVPALLEIPYLFALKDDNHIILHLCSRQQNPVDHSTLHHLCYELSAVLKKQFKPFSIAAGNIVPTAKRLIESYTGAVLRLQEAFFHKPCSINIHDSYGSEAHAQHYQASPQLLNRFQEALAEEDFDESTRLLGAVTSDIRQYPGTMIISVKELYYRFMLDMDKFAASRNVVLFQTTKERDLPWKLILECHYLDDIHQAVLLKLDELKQALRERGNGTNASTSSRIIRYIHQHFAEDDLSVQEVSEHMQMTASHLISIFKEATGKTIKQYVTEYRMEKAKDLLRGDRLKVLDIAFQVGFKDGEHFAKSFRKYTGMTPTEYRERCQS